MPAGGNRQTLNSKYQSTIIKYLPALIISHNLSRHNRKRGKSMPEIEMRTNVPLMLGVKETAERFGISEYFARKLALSGAVKAVRVGKNKILINANSVSEYFESTYINDPALITTSVITPIAVKL